MLAKLDGKAATPPPPQAERCLSQCARIRSAHRTEMGLPQAGAE